MKRRKTPNTISGLTAWGQNYLNHTAHGETQTRSSLGNETERAARLETAVARVIAEGKLRTYDMSGGRGDTDSPLRGWQCFHVRRGEGDCGLRHFDDLTLNLATSESTACPVAAATRTRRGEGGKDSILDVAKAVADYASS